MGIFAGPADTGATMMSAAFVGMSSKCSTTSEFDGNASLAKFSLHEKDSKCQNAIKALLRTAGRPALTQRLSFIPREIPAKFRLFLEVGVLIASSYACEQLPRGATGLSHFTLLVPPHRTFYARMAIELRSK